jgi:hypothetical protein
MLTDELTEVMHRAAAAQPPGADIDITRVLARCRTLRRRRRLGAGATAVVVVAGVVVGTITVRPGPGSGALTTRPPSHSVTSHHTAIGVANPSLPTTPNSVTGAQAVAAFAQWGPTRGSLATDSTFLAQVRQEWAHPTGSRLLSETRKFAGPVRVLYAGDTAGGRAAVVAQRSQDPRVGIFVGVMTAVAGHGLSLAGPNEPSFAGQVASTNVGRFDIHQVSFSAGSGRQVVILPTQPSDTVSVSAGYHIDSAGQAQRTWTPVPVTDGVALAAVPTAQSSWNTLVRIMHVGQVADEARVWINATAAPVSGNVLGYWADINAVVGTESTGISSTTFDSWLHRYAPADQPFGVSMWRIGGQLPDRAGVLVQQLWLYGGPAHTVVLLQRHGSSAVLYDRVTDPTARPLLAARLPAMGGWLVAAGPNSTVTGYRAVGSATWIVPKQAIKDYTGSTGSTKVFSRAAALLPTLDTNIEIRLIVHGVQRTVTEGS